LDLMREELAHTLFSQFRSRTAVLFCVRIFGVALSADNWLGN